jgi:hypothetical protein
MPGEQNKSAPQQTAARARELAEMAKRTHAYAHTKLTAAAALAKHELAAIRSQQITEQDLSVRINEK